VHTRFGAISRESSESSRERVSHVLGELSGDQSKRRRITRCERDVAAFDERCTGKLHDLDVARMSPQGAMPLALHGCCEKRSSCTSVQRLRLVNGGSRKRPVAHEQRGNGSIQHVARRLSLAGPLRFEHGGATRTSFGYSAVKRMLLEHRRYPLLGCFQFALANSRNTGLDNGAHEKRDNCDGSEKQGQHDDYSSNYRSDCWMARARCICAINALSHRAASNRGDGGCDSLRRRERALTVAEFVHRVRSTTA